MFRRVWEWLFQGGDYSIYDPGWSEEPLPKHPHDIPPVSPHGIAVDHIPQKKKPGPLGRPQ